jgi:hypothetical protein
MLERDELGKLPPGSFGSEWYSRVPFRAILMLREMSNCNAFAKRAKNGFLAFVSGPKTTGCVPCYNNSGFNAPTLPLSLMSISEANSDCRILLSLYWSLKTKLCGQAFRCATNFPSSLRFGLSFSAFADQQSALSRAYLEWLFWTAGLVAAFNQEVGITGAILTKLDGDSRGGAALSVKEVRR